ncbi:hypothetical protein [Bradyrhizobium sp. LeoA1S1]
MTQSRRRRLALGKITAEAVQLFRRGFDMLRGPHDPYELRDLKVALAEALGRSKFGPCPLDREPSSLIGGDREPVEVILALQAQLLRAIGEARMP